jgi:hypothetical protein
VHSNALPWPRTRTPHCFHIEPPTPNSAGVTVLLARCPSSTPCSHWCSQSSRGTPGMLVPLTEGGNVCNPADCDMWKPAKHFGPDSSRARGHGASFHRRRAHRLQAFSLMTFSRNSSWASRRAERDGMRALPAKPQVRVRTYRETVAKRIHCTFVARPNHKVASVLALVLACKRTRRTRNAACCLERGIHIRRTGQRVPIRGSLPR